MVCFLTGCSGSGIPAYSTCSTTNSYCTINSYVCCVAPADVGNGKTTCRPSNNCASGCSTHYTVIKGDTCNSIGNKYGVSGAAIISVNTAVNSGCTNLQIGQSVCIPTVPAPIPAPVRAPTPTPVKAPVPVPVSPPLQSSAGR